ncbi:hypothetical protein [Enterococcus camelliae]|uniref:Competence protein ComGG n=1 Tax=Enterococcus camelliae TaxID=453959 RepID=A0ABW5TKJ4_9ENTE
MVAISLLFFLLTFLYMVRSSAHYAKASRELIAYNYQLRIMEELFLQKYEKQLLSAQPGVNGTIQYNLGEIRFKTTTTYIEYTIVANSRVYHQRTIARSEEAKEAKELHETAVKKTVSEKK